MNKADRWALKQASIGGYKPEHKRLWATQRAVVKTTAHIRYGIGKITAWTHEPVTPNSTVRLQLCSTEYKIVKSSPSGTGRRPYR